MNEVLQAKLVELLEVGKMGVLQAADILKEQVPDLVAQILRYNFTVSLIGLILGLVCFAWVIISVKKIALVIKKEIERNKSTYANSSVSTNLIYGITGGIALIVGICNTFSNTVWIKILIAPKLYLIEYITTLVK